MSLREGKLVKKKKKRQVRNIHPGILDIPEEERHTKKVNKHTRKPKMPARIKKNQAHRRNR